MIIAKRQHSEAWYRTHPNPKSTPKEIGGHHGHKPHGPSILWPALYEHLIAKGYSKEKAARISNAAWNKKRAGMKTNTPTSVRGLAKNSPGCEKHHEKLHERGIKRCPKCDQEVMSKSEQTILDAIQAEHDAAQKEGRNMVIKCSPEKFKAVLERFEAGGSEVQRKSETQAVVKVADDYIIDLSVKGAK